MSDGLIAMSTPWAPIFLCRRNSASAVATRVAATAGFVGVAGELSQFQQTHGVSIDGVDLTTSALPDGWRSRLAKVQNENTAAPGGQPQYIGWCLDKEDLCVAKLCAFREKDRNFVDALISGNLVDPTLIADGIKTVPARYSSNIERAVAWLAYRSNPGDRTT